MQLIPYGRQDISEDDIQEVIKVLKSDYITQGPMVATFEKALAEYVNSKFSVAVCNGTAALHLACLALELGPDDILWTSPISFVASANCALYCGAGVDFIDIDTTTMNIDVACLEEKLLAAERTGTLPKIIVAVHFAGLSCDMQSIKELADKYNIRIIEDACHAIGGSYKDSMIGSCCYSDITVFSFHPVKIITTGEGGMLTTNSESLFQKIVLLRSHGINRKEFSYKTESDGDWYYEQSILGFNYRLTDIQSALGLSQLKRIDSFINTRTQLALNYNDSLKDFSLTTPEFYSDIKSAWHLYIVKLNMGFDRSEIYAQMQAAGIGVNVHYIPIHTQPYYRRLGFKPGDFPRAEQYYSQALTLPLYPALEQQQYVIDTLEQSLA